MTHPTDPSRWLVIVLAAGRGLRMGAPKALMMVRGEPWWRTQSRRLAQAGVHALWVVSPEVEGSMRDKPDAPVRRVISDPLAPMFASVLAGLRAAAAVSPPPAAVFVLPLDVPAPRGPDVYASLASSGCVALPAHAGIHGHPVCLPWSWVQATLNGSVARAAQPHALRLDELISAGAPPAIVAVNDPCVTLNINTPADLHALERVLEHAA